MYQGFPGGDQNTHFTPADLIRSVNKKVRQNYIKRRLKVMTNLGIKVYELNKLHKENNNHSFKSSQKWWVPKQLLDSSCKLLLLHLMNVIHFCKFEEIRKLIKFLFFYLFYHETLDSPPKSTALRISVQIWLVSVSISYPDIVHKSALVCK